MVKESPKDICDDILGLAMEANALAICLDNMLHHAVGGIGDLSLETRNSLDGTAKALRRSTDGVAEGIEQIDLATDWRQTDTLPERCAIGCA